MLKKISTSSMMIACCAALVGLAVLAYIGFYNRYWSDDWCYNRDFKSMGVLGSLRGYFFTGLDANRGYATNRYSSTLLSGLLYLLGVPGAEIIATLIIVLWMVGLMWLLSNISKLYQPLTKTTIFLNAAILLYYVLYLSPDRFQVLYWRSGVHYSFAVIMGTFILALITSQMVREDTSRIINYIIFPLAFTAGGLSETGCVYLFSGTFLLLLAAWIGKRHQRPWAMKAFPAILLTFLALLAAMILLIVSPSNDRYQSMGVKPADPVLVPFLSLKFSFDFILDSIKSLLLPHLVFTALFIALGILQKLFAPAAKFENSKKTLLTLVLIATITFLLIAAVQAPSAYLYRSTPEMRIQSIARFTMLAGLAIIAWIVGQVIVQRWAGNWVLAMAIAVLVSSSLYTARFAIINYRELPGYEYRAALWDRRDAAIQAAHAQGLKQVDVLVIDMQGLGTQDIMRSKDMNGQWVNNCAAQYYGFDAIRAVSP